MPKINYGYCGAGFRVRRITYIGARRMIVYSRVRILSVHVAEIMSHIESGIVSVTTVSQGVGRPVIVGITFMTASTIKGLTPYSGCGSKYGRILFVCLTVLESGTASCPGE